MLRNKEFRQFAILFFLLAAVVTVMGFMINAAAGILVMFSAIAFGAVFFVFTRERYKSIARISEQIDIVLHNADCLSFDESEEGELAILQSEITKMMLRIREQNDALKKEKKHLADSLADIAHQLRTPLTSANIILSLLANSPDEKERKALLRETEELFIRMDWLLTSLLKLSRLDAGIVVFQSGKIVVNDLINAALRPLLIPMELHNIFLDINVPAELEIWGDFSWLSEAIQNIIKNCMESAGDYGKIEIVCEDNPLFTEISIHDNGAGFEKEDFPRLFDRFYRGKVERKAFSTIDFDSAKADTGCKNENVSGYGIGLALCKMIIMRQGGTITAKNHPQGGAVFSIRFSK